MDPPNEATAAELLEVIAEGLAALEEDAGSLELGLISRGCGILSAALTQKETRWISPT